MEINGCKSRWFNIGKGCPQHSVLSPTLFISYHHDIGQFLSWCTSHFFADDLGAIIAGQMGARYTDQCIGLEKMGLFLEELTLYTALSIQAINHSKTVAMFSSRAIGRLKFDIAFNSDTKEKVEWVSEFKYLGYRLTPKL